MNLSKEYHLAKKTLHNIYYLRSFDYETISECINVMFKEIKEYNEKITVREVINYILLNNLEIKNLTRKIIIRFLNEDNLNQLLNPFSSNCDRSNISSQKLK